MKTRKVLSFVVLFNVISVGCLFAQVSFTFGPNYSSFRMKDLKSLNEELKADYGVPAKVVSSFPAYIGYDVTGSLKLKSHSLGVFWSYNSTGSRVSYNDYSGGYRYDQRLSAKQVGFEYGQVVKLQNEFWELVPSFRLGLINTSHQISSYLKVGSQSSTEKYDFISKSVLVSPGLTLRRIVSSWLYLSADLRYLIDIPENLVLKSNHKIYLFNQQNTPLAAQWSGVRFIVTVGVRLNKK